MYALSPEKIYVMDSARQDDRCRARIEQMLSAIGRTIDDAKQVTDADIPEVVRQNGWARAREYQGARRPHRDPSLVFTVIKSDDTAPPDGDALLKQCPAGTSGQFVSSMLGLGGGMVAWAEGNPDKICRSRHQFDTIYGCPHGCAYCEGGMVSVVFANVEEFVRRHVDPVVRANRWQKVFMFNSCLTDTLCFEPEYGLSELLAEYFAGTVDQHYLIHSKSANVDFLTRLDHGGHTILLWSLTPDSVQPILEPATATSAERIAAAARCQAAGYTVRFKLKPIVPVKGWRDEYRAMIDRIFTETRPDNIALCLLAWMDFERLRSILDLSLLDPEFAAAAEQSAEALKGRSEGPFPHASRAAVYGFLLDEIRRHDRKVPVALCTETARMWREFAPRLGVGPGEYVCGCGPQCSPGLERLDAIVLPER